MIPHNEPNIDDIMQMRNFAIYRLNTLIQISNVSGINPFIKSSFMFKNSLIPTGSSCHDVKH